MTVPQADSVSPTDEVKHRRPPHKEFRPDIEGLRAIAVVAVVLFHARVPGVSGGLVGVDVFFIISGFLITGLLWREVGSTGTVGLRRFYGARARRLLPASATVGVVIMIGAALLSPVLRLRNVFVDGIASALYVSNYRFMLQGVDYLADALPSPFLHYWSLGVEEQFYLVWPALIIGTAWLVRRARWRTKDLAAHSERPYLIVLALVAAISFVLSLVFTRTVPPVAFFSLPTRAWELAVGGLVALTAGQWRRLPALVAAIAGCVGLGMILVACVRFGSSTPYPGTAALLPVLGAALVIGAGCAVPAQGVGRVLAVRPMRAIGRVSYSWYLWHWPLLLVVPASATANSLGQRLTAVFVSLGLAFLTLRFIENPLRFAGPLRRSPNRSLAVGGTATAIAAGVGVALMVGMPAPVGHGPAASALTITSTRPPIGSSIYAYDAAVQDAFAQVHSAVAASVALKAVPSNLTPPLAGVTTEVNALYLHGCLRNFLEVGQPECASGDTASTTTVALVGDSDAAMWNPAFVEVAAQRHWRLETLTKAACPMLDLPTINRSADRPYTECDQWRGQVTARLNAERPRLIVLGMTRGYGSGNVQSSFKSYDPQWINSLNRLVKQLRDTGAQLLVLGPIPIPLSVVPDCLASHLDDAPACSTPTSKAVNQVGITTEAAATTAGGGQYADLTQLFCTADRCPAIVGNTLVYLDEAHLTREYSRLLAPVMGALADRALATG
ncbi:acyltransferase family protein [Mycobacterium sp. E3198]|uniref:acyltransferase family protein n=1 Tax=Mycobacterium sp. E3198 TaxID=1834143 RepID=UPI001E3B5274|nr:acyltransferase family protein [Mycobacterium sp. E3198]